MNKSADNHVVALRIPVTRMPSEEVTEAACALVERILTGRRPGSPVWSWDNLVAETIHLDKVCDEAAFPLEGPAEQTKRGGTFH